MEPYIDWLLTEKIVYDVEALVKGKVEAFTKRYDKMMEKVASLRENHAEEDWFIQLKEDTDDLKEKIDSLMTEDWFPQLKESIKELKEEIESPTAENRGSRKEIWSHVPNFKPSEECILSIKAFKEWIAAQSEILKEDAGGLSDSEVPKKKTGTELGP